MKQESLKSGFHLVGVGNVVEDKKFLGSSIDDTGRKDISREQNSYEIEVVLIEATPTVEGDLTAKENKNVTTTDINGSVKNQSLEKGKSITARWIDLYNSNRRSAPDVVAGEKVHIFQQGGNDEYFWASISNNLRKREKVVYGWANRDKNANQDDYDVGEHQYYVLVDTTQEGKEVVFHTSDTDGEATTYDLIFDTKKGIVTLKDKQENFVELRSVDGILTVRINNDIIIHHDRDMKITTGQHHTETVGGNYSLTVSGNTTIKTSGNTNITTDGNTAIKTSGTTNITSGGACVIKGKPVAIN